MNTDKSVIVNNLEVAFGEFRAVKGISFDVVRGEIFGFLGANGAGKTTTIRVLCGLIPPTAGKVMVAGADPATEPMMVKSRVGYMSQKFTLYRDMTISENLKFTAKLRGIADGKISSRINELVNFIELDWPLSTMVRDLPAGVLQQVSLISATIHDPEIVFLDEPTAGVTPAARSRFWKLIATISGAGKTVFVTTHYMDEAEQCNRVALMRAGDLIALDSPDALKTKAFPEPIYEITAPPNAGSGWQEEIKSGDLLYELQTFGMRYHARIRSPEEFEKYLKTKLPNFLYKKIRPSLEDVFIRLVEGQNR